MQLQMPHKLPPAEMSSQKDGILPLIKTTPAAVHQDLMIKQKTSFNASDTNHTVQKTTHIFENSQSHDSSDKLEDILSEDEWKTPSEKRKRNVIDSNEEDSDDRPSETKRRRLQANGQRESKRTHNKPKAFWLNNK